jgi:hypothetical protein
LKIRIDHNLSYRVARAVVAALANRDGYEVSHVQDAHAPGTKDPDWLRAFASEGGTAIVSGDCNILQNKADLVAYTETGLISFFPPKPFEALNRFGKIAFLVRWWPQIVEKIKLSSLGDRWRLPMDWKNPSHIAMEPLRDPRVDGRRVVLEKPSAVVLPLKHTGTDRSD